MRTVVVDIPYEIRIMGVPKRKRTPDMYFVRETVPVEIACHDAGDVEATLTNPEPWAHSLKQHSSVGGRMFSPVGWVGPRAVQDRSVMRRGTVEPLRLEDMDVLSAFCRTRDSLHLTHSPFRLRNAQRRNGDISRYHEKRLVAMDAWSAIEESDIEAARADAVVKAGGIVAIDGILHTDQHQPVVRLSNSKEWNGGTVDLGRSFSQIASDGPTFGYGEPMTRFARRGPIPSSTVPFARIACCGLLRDAIELVYPYGSSMTAAVGTGTLCASGTSSGLVDAVFDCRVAIRTVDDKSVDDRAAFVATERALKAFDARLGSESPFAFSPAHGSKARSFMDSIGSSIERLAELVELSAGSADRVETRIPGAA